MKVLDWFLIKRFLITYVFSVVVIVLVIMAIDYVEKNDNFIEKQVTGKSIFFDYYLNFAPYWALTISPLMIFISTVFFTAKLANHTEIIAIFGSGVSFRRLMYPYFIGASVVAFASFILVGWILPDANKVRIAFEKKYLKDKMTFSERDFHVALAKDIYVYLSNYDSANNTAYDFTLEKVEGNQMLEKLSARRAVYMDSLHKWRLYDYRIRKLGILKDKITLAQSSSAIDTVLNISPKDFENSYKFYETLSIPELIKHINVINTRGAEGVELFKIEYYRRYATPFGVIILSIMGLIVSARKARGGVGFQIAIGFVLAFIYILFYILSVGIAERGSFDPIFAVWLPNIVFSFIALVMYWTVPR